MGPKPHSGQEKLAPFPPEDSRRGKPLRPERLSCQGRIVPGGVVRTRLSRGNFQGKIVLQRKNYPGSITRVAETIGRLPGLHNMERLGDLQLRILRVLWQHGECTVAQVQQYLAQEQSRLLAYTTVATMLRKMEARGLVRHRSQGRRFLYQAAVSDEQVSQRLAGYLLDRLFEGSLAQMVNHLLEHRQVDPQELDRLEELIRRKKGESGT